ncbi:NHL repeat containing protein [Nostoc sp. PCC 7107]|uniref:NHL repeat containing protein n=1 Tax=Nostoc sp. PCC 7107 TaxID=317936 RepID=UPI00029F3906|nr:NHL repeat containing protein [Nostoc sp. PCC 7107]AFY45112.1 NHL repeat containing protein [Nostoc sp. PCC 7107]
MQKNTHKRFRQKYQQLNQYIQKVFKSGNNRQLKPIYFMLLGITVIFIAFTLDITSEISVTGVAASTYKTSWIGNTFGGGDKWVQNNIEAMYVAPNGTVYTNSHWDEAGREAGIYKDGNVIGIVEDTHGWSRSGGKAVTANSKYIYITLGQGAIGKTDKDYPPEGTTWYTVRRYNLAGKPAPFNKGRGWDKSMLIVSNQSEVTGLATVGNELYVSDYATNKIRVYNSETMQELRSFSVANPGAIAIDKQANIWVLQNQNKILRYSPTGKQLPQQITNIPKPTAIAIDHQGRLLVADNSQRQQVLIYNIKNQPVQVGTFGTKGGVYANTPGEVQALKLYGITGIGGDSSGNIYVNSNGFNKSGTDLRKFSASGKPIWQLHGLLFVDNADVDPQTDGLEVFTKQEHFLMDYNQPSGKQWTYKAYTLNPFKYPQDPRLHTSPDATFVRRIQGKRFLFMTNMYASFMQIYRFDSAKDGKIAIPAGMFVGTHGGGEKSVSGNWPPHQPNKGEWIWRDRNGNGKFDQGEYDQSEDYPYLGGWWVDNKGDIWKTLRTQDGIGIRHYPLQGLDQHGNPMYSYSSMQKQKTPSMITDLRRIEYFPETDTMYLSGFTVDHPAVGDDSGVVGSEIIRFDNWRKGNNPTLRWRTVIPHDTTGKREVSTAAMSVAGDYVFAVKMKTAEVYVYNAKTGATVKTLKPGAEVAGESGWIDIPQGIRAFRRSNGEYVVFVEEDWKGKVIMYRFNS